MNVLSLFDGMACGLQALKELNIPVNTYYASEIDKYAIQISNKNHPEINNLGDIRKWRDWPFNFAAIDLVFAGFPCQAWSVAGKGLGKNDERGALAWVMMDIFNHIRSLNPKVKFLFENVRMKKSFLQEINDLIGVEPILINSALVSAQNRIRYYWHNLGEIDQPEDRKIYLKDILESGSIAVNYSSSGRGNGKIEERMYLNPGKAHTLTKTGYSKRSNTCVFVGSVGEKIQGDGSKSRDYRQGDRVYSVEGKSTTLNAVGGGKAGKTGLYLVGLEVRQLTSIECEKLQGLPINYTQGVSESQRKKMIGNGWELNTIKHLLKNL